MNDTRDPGDVFAIPDLYAPSALLSTPSEYFSVLFSELKFADIDGPLPSISVPKDEDEVFFSIPDLSFGASDACLTPNLSHASSASEAGTDQPALNTTLGVPDIWTLPIETPILSENYQSWEGFESEKDERYASPYITEAGPLIFDTAVAAKDDYLRIVNGDYVVVKSDIYLAALLNLGQGRSSVFFAWNDSKQVFMSVLSKIRISGYGGSSLEQLMATFLGCGNMTRSLKSFVEKTYSSSTSAGRVALADTVSTLLATVQSQLSTSTATIRTILQLQALFQPIHSILTCFQRVVTNVAATRSDESMLSTIFEEIQLMEHRTDSLREVLLEILSRVSQPWLEFAGEWLGIQKETGLPLSKRGKGKSFVKVEDKEWVDEQGFEIQHPDYVLDYDKVPSFIAPDDARSLFEVGRSLRFLRDHHPDHLLAGTAIISSANPPSLEWRFSWEEVVRVESKALQYEKNLTDALLHFSAPTLPETSMSMDEKRSSGHSFELNLFGRPEEEMQAHVLASIDVFDKSPSSILSENRLSLGLNEYFSRRTELSKRSDPVFAPPISLSPVLSFNPVIAAQARIVNGTCMRLFFGSHELRKHLAAQRDFHLLGNGVFSSRLSHALFDPDLESAERHQGVARSGGIMGLRLGGRDTWPPASSELRLSLMGVLTESYSSTRPLGKSWSGPYHKPDPLPGDLSFSVRDMTEEEIERCMNPDSIEALDFLRLSYKPPSPLEVIITPIILFKYDQLFKSLLRVVRMLYVVNSLFRDATDRTSCWHSVGNVAQRFRIEAHHFISSVSGYFFDTGIEATWRVFERKLDQIEARISKDSDNITLGQNEGLDKLRDYHERVLDRIMFALFLRKRQQPVLKLLEEIFTLILQFAKYSRERALGLPTSQEGINQIYARFQKKVGVFISVCRGLSEKKGYGDKKVLDNKMLSLENLFDGDDLAEENTVSQLLLRLEMSSYHPNTT